jgi:hypothetical protein
VESRSHDKVDKQFATKDNCHDEVGSSSLEWHCTLNIFFMVDVYKVVLVNPILHVKPDEANDRDSWCNSREEQTN